MAQRNCYFKDCHSRGDSSGRTFFNFPFRDPERLFRWLAVTGCTKLELERKPRYVCDLHFNKKFFATCQRRKVLVGQAIPDLHRVESSLSDEPSAADTTGHPMADENDDVKKSDYDENNDDEVEYVDDNELFLNENDGLEYREDQTASTGEEESGFPPAAKEAIKSRGAKSVTVLNGKMLKGQVVFTPINEKRSSSPLTNIPTTLSRTNPPKRPKLEEQGSCQVYYLI